MFDVAVIGYGPTGLVAASLLGRLGHRVVVCERWPALYGLPRLTHIDGETARAVQAAADVDAALRDSSPTEYFWVNGEDELLFHVPGEREGPMGFPTHISMYQPDVEDAIDARVRTMSNVDVRQGRRVVGVSQDADSVELTLTRPGDDEAAGPDERLRARYVVAADGSKSAVRDALGIERDDFGFNERWLNFDTEWLRPPPPEFAVTKQYCDPARGHMFMIIGKRRQRFEFALLPDERSEDFDSPEAAWRLLRQAHGLGADDVKIIRQIVYTFEARVARRWRAGRVFLAGDAAHTMPPYLGQGACSGIRDATNLAWKLDLVLRGRASDSLLDTYEAERRPHAATLVHMSMGLGEIANMRDPVAAARRDAAFRSGNASPPPDFPTLQAGVVHREPSGAVAAPAGSLVPQGHVSSAGRHGRLDDLIGTGFALIGVGDPGASLTAGQLGYLDDLGCRVVDLGADVVDEDGAHTAFLRDLGAVAYLARPDFVLFGAASEPAQIGALVDELRDMLERSDELSTVGS